MRTTISRLVNLTAAAGLAAALILPAAAPVAAAEEPRILRVGTIQDLDSMNPWNTALTTGFEAFTLNYDLLVNFGQDLEPVPGYAESWERAENADGTFTWTFKMRDGMKWSDGEPATAEDARWTLQFVLDAVTAGEYVGLGYIDPDLANAGVTKVEAPDATTLVVTNTDPSDRILQMYIPILPKHIWEGQTLESIPTFANDPTVVGSGPYQAVEWQTGQFARFAQNPNYWGPKGAAEEVVLQFYASADTMVQALKGGDLDYALGINADQFDSLKSEPDIAVVNGPTNGWTMLNINSYDKDIPGGGASTKALRDPAFRDAIGYAIDKPTLVDRVLGGYGTPGTTQVPPFQERWHVEPDKPRTFDVALADEKLTAAGYPKDASGQRLDKEGKPINLRLYLATDSVSYEKAAAFIVEWFAEIGIKVTTATYDEATLIEIELPPEAGEGYTADWDMIIWSWTGYADPGPLLQIFTTDFIGSTSDSLWSNATYDELYTAQAAATDPDERHRIMAEMQNLFYDEAPYHILFYEDTLVAHRTDKFANWTNQPASAFPLFGYGSFGYPLLTVASAESPAPSAEAPSAGASEGPAASPAPGTPTSSDGSMVLPIVLLVVVLGAAAGGLVMRARSKAADEED
jgi:peptide/nickel transport system substrate-binding protein